MDKMVMDEGPVDEGLVDEGLVDESPVVAKKTNADFADIEAIVGGYHGAPHQILGIHEGMDGDKPCIVVRAFRPLEKAVFVLDVKNDRQFEMERVHEGGFFELVFSRRRNLFRYRLVLHGNDGSINELEDPYAFPFLLTDFDLHLHGEGTFTQSYAKMGAQMRTATAPGGGEVGGVNFAVWAPNAQRVGVIGPFNGWDNRMHAMTQRAGGIWELFIPNLPEGIDYKYAVKSQVMGYEVDKADPFGFYADLRPGTASRVWDLHKYEWADAEWMAQRPVDQAGDQPISVYEVHLGSWRRTLEGTFLSYRDLAHQMVDHCKELGFTHIELMPITEHPFDGSWGYQTVGYFAPTSRFGTPDDFKYFVDHCHRNDIGVILDWVPAHFPKDAHGLAFFDGTHLYEHSDPRQGEHQDWGTKIFNFDRNEVCNFLLNSALFWLKEYHIDGLRVDAVASMLYLDYSREQGQWVPNEYGGRENLGAIDFLRRFNELTHAEFPGVLTIAEESTSWPMVTRPTYMGGLGFDMKWNMGWMNDTLSYLAQDPIYRRYHHGAVTFSLMYAFSENFILPFSHDEVVHLKKSMLDKMPGDLWQKFANLRLLYGYMFGHPGKKLIFMGGEFGQWTEWNENKSLDWHLLAYPDHQKLMHFMTALSQIYRSEPALYEVDHNWEGFQWIDFSDADQSILSFIRRAKDTSDEIVVVCNFTPVPRMGYRVGLPQAGFYREILNSDSPQFGGSGVGNGEGVTAEAQPWQTCTHSAPINLAPLSVTMFKRG